MLWSSRELTASQINPTLRLTAERQLVMMARAMAPQPSVLLFDELTSYLDFKNQILTLKMIKDISRSQGVTVVMTLHNPNHALMFSDEVVLFKKALRRTVRK